MNLLKKNAETVKCNCNCIGGHRGQMHDMEMACRTQPRIKPQTQIVTAEAYFSAKFGPNVSDFFDLCLHWVLMMKDHRVLQTQRGSGHRTNKHGYLEVIKANYI